MSTRGVAGLGWRVFLPGRAVSRGGDDDYDKEDEEEEDNEVERPRLVSGILF